MKTSDAGNKYTQFSQNRNNTLERNRNEDFQDFQQDLNEERIISSYKPKEKVFYYDNSAISMSYGQYNVEKCLVVLFLLIIYSACLFYNYYPFLDKLNIILLLSSSIVDVIISFLYLYFLVKLKSDQIFNRIPIGILNSTDIVIMMNLLLKLITIVNICVDYTMLGAVSIVLFSFKFLFDFYFAVISVKLLMFCPCSVIIQEQTEKIWAGIKYYIFCCEADNEPENPEYTRLEDIESFY